MAAGSSMLATIRTVPPQWTQAVTSPLRLSPPARMRCSWSGARLHHSLAAVGARRLLSTPSHEAFDSGLGSALARTLARSGRSPNLTGFTFGVSSGGLKLLQVPCVYQFHHSGWLDSLPSPFSPDYRRACSNCTARLAPSWLLAVQETNTGCIPEGMETCAIPSFAGHSLTKKRLDKGGFKCFFPAIRRGCGGRERGRR